MNPELLQMIIDALPHRPDLCLALVAAVTQDALYILEMETTLRDASTRIQKLSKRLEEM
jgi:hypothetical protein